MEDRNFLWVEKYRPKTVEDAILPRELKTVFREFVNQGNIPNLLLSGTAGTGKTTIAKAMLNEIGATWIMINGSEETGIDVLRNKIKNFASTVSMDGGRKYVILDEAEYLNPSSTQPALRGFIEEFHKNCGFILTCNFRNRIIEPLQSRCSVVEFNIPNKQKPQLAFEFLKRTENILAAEGISYEEKSVAMVIEKHFPDWRRVLNELQRYSVSGKIDSGIMVNMASDNISNLMELIKNKEFQLVRKWIVNNLDNDPSKIFRMVFDSLYTKLDPSTIPHAILILADYQYKSSFVADQEINMLACMTELMSQVKFK